jgi:hypothetical protein
VYGVFGIGSMHAPYVISQKYSKKHNEGVLIGFIRAAGTQMAGTILVLLQLIQFQPELICTITSLEFLKLKVFLFDC